MIKDNDEIGRGKGKRYCYIKSLCWCYNKRKKYVQETEHNTDDKQDDEIETTGRCVVLYIMHDKFTYTIKSMNIN